MMGYWVHVDWSFRFGHSMGARGMNHRILQVVEGQGKKALVRLVTLDSPGADKDGASLTRQ